MSELNPETLKAMKEASDALKGVRRACTLDDADPRFVDFIVKCNPANVSALIAEVERQAREIEELNQELNKARMDCALVDCPARQDD